MSDKGLMVLPTPLSMRKVNLDQSLREITIDLTKVEMVVTLGDILQYIGRIN